MSSTNKRGVENAGNVAVVIFLIALFLAIYVLLLPPADRNALLNEDRGITNKSTGMSKASSIILLSQNPGVLKPFDSDTVVHKLDPVNLFLKDEPRISDLATSIAISNGLFGEEVRKLSFNSEDLDNLNKATLFFSVRSGESNLIILLNGVEIFAESAEGLNDVILPLNLLREQNILEFRVSGAIFGRNEYALRDIKIRQSFELTNTIELRRFVLSSTEEGDGLLSYTIFCNSAGRNSRLKILVNGDEITNEAVACRSATRSVEIDSKLLNEGTNEVEFKIDDGDYLLNNVKIEVKSEEGGSVSYSFPITETEFDDIKNLNKAVILDIDFYDNQRHRALLEINGDEFSLDMEGDTYSKEITRFVKSGNNKIKITPQNEFELNLVEIRLR